MQRNIEGATLNIQRLQDMFDGNVSDIHEILQLSVATMEKGVRAITEALDREDVVAARTEAHALKGAAANIGAERASGFAMMLEQEAKGAFGLSAMRDLRDNLEKEWAILRERIAAEVSQS